MNTVTIGFLAHGPASANSLKPLIDILKLNKSNSIKLYAYHEYVSDLWESPKLHSSEGYPNDMKFLDILVYGTGSGNEIELGVPEYCKTYGIISISILDLFWSEYGDLGERFPLLPDYTLLPDSETLKQIEKELGESIGYHITGNPHFDRLQNQAFQRTLNKPFSVGFFSQCTTTGDYSYINKDSYLALMELVKYRNNNPEDIKQIKVKAHPRENKELLKELCNLHNLTYSDEDSTVLLDDSDFIYGYKCTLQYEAMLIGKPVSFFGKECLEATIDKLLTSPTKPTIGTVNATIKCLSIVSGVIDFIVLRDRQSKII